MRPDLAAPSLFVFSHPNHEVGVFGFLQRMKPHLVYLTDGGGEERVSQTRRGLTGLGLLANAVFLGVAESACYRALVLREPATFTGMVSRLREEIARFRPAQLFCDAVEYYNPVHDIALPVVLAAAGASSTRPVFEIPLVRQRPGEVEAYDVQRPPPGSQETTFELRLTTAEISEKLNAFHGTYHLIRELFATGLGGVPLTFVDTEVVVPARPPLRPPGPDAVLRYERRARLLKERGAIAEEITWSGHYLPVATALVAGVYHPA